jgi:hypothetical protein
MRGLLAGFALLLLVVGLIAIVTSLPEDGTESGTDPVPVGRVDGEAEIRERQFRPGDRQRAARLTGDVPQSRP